VTRLGESTAERAKTTAAAACPSSSLCGHWCGPRRAAAVAISFTSWAGSRSSPSGASHHGRNAPRLATQRRGLGADVAGSDAPPAGDCSRGPIPSHACSEHAESRHADEAVRSLLRHAQVLKPEDPGSSVTRRAAWANRRRQGVIGERLRPSATAPARLDDDVGGACPLEAGGRGRRGRRIDGNASPRRGVSRGAWRSKASGS